MRTASRNDVLGLAYVGILVLVAGFAVGLVWRDASPRFDLVAAVGFTAAFFATRLLTIRLPQGDEVYVTLLVGMYALAVADIPTALVASLAAGIVESVARFSQSSRSIALARLRDVVRGTAVLGFLTPLQPMLRTDVAAGGQGEVLIAWVLGVGVVYAGLDVLTMAVQQRLTGGLPVAQGIAALRRPLLTMYLVHLAMAAVAVRLFAASATWAFPIALLLTLILQNSFNLYLRIRRGYGETIGALARAAELDRPQDAGHAQRVADLAVSVGRQLGLTSQELERVGYAALLHDIGRMGAWREDSSGADVNRGVALLSSIPFLADVAPLLESNQSSSQLGGSIVRACSQYDRSRFELGVREALSVLEAKADSSDDPVLRTLHRTVLKQYRGEGMR